jgi:hypothetical protein
MRTAITLAIGLALLVGCTTFTNSAGKVLASSAMTVDAAMQGWATWVSMGKAGPTQETQVKAAYQKYQVAIQTATLAYQAAVVSGDQTAWKQAETVLTQTQSSVLNLISQFTKTP